MRSLEDDGFLVTVDEQVALRDIQLDGAGKATDVRECLPGNRCPFISDVLQPDSECEPAIGCATVDSASGTLRAIHVATLLNRRPSVYYVYQLRTEREITAILEPGGSAKWDGKSDYLVLSFDGLPPAYSTETLTVSYADGGTDQLIMSFEIPLSASTTTTASYWGCAPGPHRRPARWRSRSALCSVQNLSQCHDLWGRAERATLAEISFCPRHGRRRFP